MSSYPSILRRRTPAQQHAPRATGMLVCLVLMAALSACGTAQSGSTGPKTTPSPTTDPVLQHYAEAVHTYYQTFSYAIDYENRDCRLIKPTTPWTVCQSATASVLKAGQTLLAQLPATPPPAQLQQVDAMLKQATQATLSAYMKRAPAVAAHDTAAFLDGNVVLGQAIGLQCEPVSQFDRIAPPDTNVAPPHGQCFSN